MKTLYLKLSSRSTDAGIQYAGSCFEQNALDGEEVDDLQMGPDERIEITDLYDSQQSHPYSLGEVLRALRDYRLDEFELAFDERGQVALGRWLYDQTLGRFARYAHLRDVDLRIFSEDEYLAALPWPLLYRHRSFLVAEGWTVSLVTSLQPLEDLRLGRFPRVLIAAPEPSSLSATQRDLHISQLQILLRECGVRVSSSQDCCVVTTWDEFRRALQDSEFDIVYYYGHGVGDAGNSRLVFEAEDGGDTVERTAGDIADQIRQAKQGPRIAYINCCHGDAGGLLGMGQQLGNVLPCVVTNRTIVPISAARAQAMAFWRRVLKYGDDPRVAVARNYQRLGDLALSRSAPHWFTPVLHANYGGWSAELPARSPRATADPSWIFRVDRKQQFGQLILLVQEMIREGKPRALATFWLGEEGQGMLHFQQRLEIDLGDHIKDDATVIPYRPRWPDYYVDDTRRRFSSRGFEEMLYEAFEVEKIEEIPARVDSDSRGRTAIIVLNHPHTRNPGETELNAVEDYLAWWDEYVLERFDNRQHCFVITFSFEPDNAADFEEQLNSRVVDECTMRDIAPGVLPTMESLAVGDLNDFLRRHNVHVPQKDRRTLLKRIIDKTKGRYEATLLELEKLIDEGYESMLVEESEP